MPYLIEFEQSEKAGKKMTAVRILDPTQDAKEIPGSLAELCPGPKLIAETVYLGAPPGLCFQAGHTFTLLRVPACEKTKP